MDLETAICQVQRQSNVMRSLEADFEKMTWTFGAPYFIVSAGDYVLIPKNDWQAFLSNLRAPQGRTVTTEENDK